MAVIRLTLLVGVLGGLTLLLVQNWSPVLSLVFLGMRTQPLPLAIWILFSIAAGAGTSILISILFKLSNYFVEQPRQTRFKSPATPPRAETTRIQEPTPRPSNPPRASTSEDFDDWETGGADNDWDFDEQPQETPNPKTQPFRDAPSYERETEPKTGSQSGSVYSYSYREPKNTAAGKTESVYDADYRVIIPPYQPPTKDVAADNDEDDWGFDDDELEDDKPRK